MHTSGSRNLALLGALVLMTVVFTIASKGQFLDPGNLSTISLSLACTAIVALGMLLIMLVGHIDLSVGSGIGLCGAIVAVLISKEHWPALPAALVAIITACAIWALMGWSLFARRIPVAAIVTVVGALIFYALHQKLPQLDTWSWVYDAGSWLKWVVLAAVPCVVYLTRNQVITTQRIPAFIITLAGMLIFKGIYWDILGNETRSLRDGGADNLLSILASHRFGPVASAILAGVVLLIMTVGALRSRASRLRHGFPTDDIETVFLKLICIGQGLVLGYLLLREPRPNGDVEVFPLSFVLLGTIAAVIWVITAHTRLGRYFYACGSNEPAAALSGVPVRAVTVAAFAICGITVAITGMLQAARIGNATNTLGDMVELDAIAACVIGGVAVKGGRGTVGGVLFGALLIAVLLNGLVLMSVPESTKFIIRGAVLAIAVWMDVKLSKR